jgi:hypothetical protein
MAQSILRGRREALIPSAWDERLASSAEYGLSHVPTVSPHRRGREAGWFRTDKRSNEQTGGPRTIRGMKGAYSNREGYNSSQALKICRA